MHSHLAMTARPARMPWSASQASLRREIPADTRGQTLLDASLEAHWDVLIMAMHIAAPDGSGHVTAASNIGRIGEKADDGNMAVIRTGKPNIEVNEGGNRFAVEIPMTDVKQRRI